MTSNRGERSRSRTGPWPERLRRALGARRRGGRHLSPMIEASRRISLRIPLAVLAVAAVVGAGWGLLPRLFESAPATSATVVVTTSIPPPTTVGVSTSSADPAAVLQQAQTALEDAGYGTITVELEGSTALLEGVVPVSVLEDGFFRFVDGAKATVVDVPGVELVVSRLRLKGDAAELRAELSALVEASPIAFAGGSSTLDESSGPVLDRAAALINGQPGLTVLIAGHTDPAGSAAANQALARGRGLAVFEALVARGVAPNRLSVLSYGELFPNGQADPRRIEFEVGP